MSFQIDGNNKKIINIVIRQFSGFLKTAGKLPIWHINFYSLQKGQFTENKKLASINSYCFYRLDDGFLFFYDGNYLKLSSDFKQADFYLYDKIKINETSIMHLLLLGYRYTMAACSNLVLHSALSVYNDSGILFCGKPGAGKSTQSNLWTKYLSAWNLNFDQPCLICEDDQIYAHGSPWSGKERCCINSYVPAKALVLVEQAPYCEITRLRGAQAFSHIYLNNYLYPVSKDIEKKHIDVIMDITQRLPVYVLKCTISEDAVAVAYEEIFKSDYKIARKEANMKYLRRENFQMREIAGDYLIIPRGEQALDYSAVLVLNETGAFLWDKLEAPLTENQLTHELVLKYGIDVETACRDTLTFIEKLKENKLVEVIEE